MTRRLPSPPRTLAVAQRSGKRAEHADADANRNANFPILDAKGTLVPSGPIVDAARNREVFDRQYKAEFEADWAKTVELVR